MELRLGRLSTSGTLRHFVNCVATNHSYLPHILNSNVESRRITMKQRASQCGTNLQKSIGLCQRKKCMISSEDRTAYQVPTRCLTDSRPRCLGQRNPFPLVQVWAQSQSTLQALRCALNVLSDTFLSNRYVWQRIHVHVG